MADNDPPDSDSDPFGPPKVPTLVGCLHCGQEYDSYRIEWRIERCADGRRRGFWCCPIPGCDGKGFGFDILPVDPNYQDEHGGWFWDDGDESGDDDEGEGNPPPGGSQGDELAGPGEEDSIPW